jgi:hypothetical protein
LDSINSHKLESDVRVGKDDIFNESSFLFMLYMIELLRTEKNY